MTMPTRYPGGISNAAPWQFFSGMGVANPFYYHSFVDDFDIAPAENSWEAFGTGSGTLASGDGGVTTRTTLATVGSISAIQRESATFQPAVGKKLYFVTRVTLTDVVDAALGVGIVTLADTPFTPPPNGIWIGMASGGTQLTLNVANNGTITTNNFPTSAYTLVNNVSFDVGFIVKGGTGKQPVRIIGAVAPTLVSYIPQSGTGAIGSTDRAPSIASTAPLLTTLQNTVLAPTLAVQTGVNSVITATFDFAGCFRER